MRTHELKTWPSSFQAILDGTKHHEVRLNDRDFAVGDELILREWDPAKNSQSSLAKPEQAYTKRRATVRVSFITPGGAFGVPVGYVVMSIEPTTTPAVAPWDCAYVDPCDGWACTRPKGHEPPHRPNIAGKS